MVGKEGRGDTKIAAKMCATGQSEDMRSITVLSLLHMERVGSCYWMEWVVQCGACTCAAVGSEPGLSQQAS